MASIQAVRAEASISSRPSCKRKPGPGPAGEVENDRHRLIRIVFRSLQQFPRQFQEQGGFARARRTKEEEATRSSIIRLDDRGPWWERRDFACLEMMKDEVGRRSNAIGSLLQGQSKTHLPL